MLTVSQLYIYPIKSLGGIPLDRAALSDRGFEYDRRWMLIDDSNRFLSQREHPVMALLQVTLDGQDLLVRHKTKDEPPLRISGSGVAANPASLATSPASPVPLASANPAASPATNPTATPTSPASPVPLASANPAASPATSPTAAASSPSSTGPIPGTQPGGPIADATPAPATNTSAPLSVSIWDDTCPAVAVSQEADAWFSRMLGMSCRLVYMPDETRREVEANYARDHEITSFSDGYPLLIIGQASLDDLNDRLEQPLPMDRFRPNIVFTGGEAYQEDGMQAFEIAGISFFGVKPCARCVMTLINQDTAAKGKEPLRTLSTYRMRNNKIYFGQNLLFRGSGSIAVGDSISLPATPIE